MCREPKLSLRNIHQTVRTLATADGRNAGEAGQGLQPLKLPAWSPPHNSLGQTTYTYVTKQHNLVLAKGQWRSSAGKVTACQIRPQKYPFPGTDPQTPLTASSMDPSDLWCQTASGSDPPFFHNALDRPTHRPTDRPQESLIATRATRPNNLKSWALTL